ncbi:MAG: tetratricopeptide repeat protein [Candidatus Niyogibacteria bacterium]|nr:tetratricopeptide repeat protein [Candidatus Niyogibacteria bacterium]
MESEEISIPLKKEAAEDYSADFKKEAGENIFDKTARTIFYVLGFLLPLWILPITASPLELNKAYLTYFLVIFALFFWLAGRIKTSSIDLPKSFFFFSLVLLALVWGLAVIFSQSPHFSFGGTGSEAGTFVSVLTGVIAAFLAMTLFQNAAHVFKWFLILFVSAGLVFIAKFFQMFFNFPFWKEIFNVSTFNLIGNWNNFGIFSGLIVFLSLAFLEIIKSKSIKLFPIIMLVLSFLALALVNFIALWWVLSVFLIIFLSYLFVLKKSVWIFFSWTSIVLIIVLFFLLAQPLAVKFISFTGVNINFLEVRPSWSATWTVVKSVLSEHFLVGSGPNTFLYDWLAFKPASLNDTLFWDARFSEGAGLLFSFLAEAGILGFLVFLLLFGSLLRRGFQIISRPDSSVAYHLLIASFFSAAYLWIMNIFYTPGFLIFIFSFIFSGLFIGLAIEQGFVKKYHFPLFKNNASGFISVILMISFLLFGLAGVFYFSQKYFAAYSFRQGLAVFNASGDLAKAEAMILRATKFDGRDYYWRSLVEINLEKLQRLLSRQDITGDEMMAQFQNILSDAIKYGQEAARINPADPLNWVTLAKVYEAVTPLGISGAAEAANNFYEEAKKRDPQSPAHFLAQARLAVQSANLEKARDLLNKAIVFKSDYTPARFLLAQIAVQEGKTNEAILRLEEARFLAPNDLGVLFQLGLLYYQKGDFERAKAVLERAVGINSDYSNARYFLGLAYDRLNKKTEALAQFERVLKLNPGHSEVMRILENIKKGKSALSGISSVPEERKEPPVD